MGYNDTLDVTPRYRGVRFVKARLKAVCCRVYDETKTRKKVKERSLIGRDGERERERERERVREKETKRERERGREREEEKER